MGENNVQAPPMSPVPLQAVLALAAPLQVVPAPATIPTSAPLAAIHEVSQASGAMQGNRVVEDGVIQQLRWIEKLVFVCIFLPLYAIFKKWGYAAARYVWVCMCMHVGLSRINE